MKRAIAIGSAMAIALCAVVTLAAQGKDFSGKWSVDAEKTAAANPAAAAGGGGGRAGGGGGRGGAAVTVITMDAKTMKIERQGADGTAMGSPTVYNLDGSVSKNEQAGRGGAAATTVESTAKWDGAKLVITTKGANGDQVTSYWMDGANLTSERTTQNGAQKTVYKKG